MTDLALVALFFVIVVVGVVTVHLLVHSRQPQKHPNALWIVEEHPRAIGHSGPTAYAFYCVHPDEEPQLVDAIDWDDSDFELKADEIRVEAQLRCDTLNRKLKLLKR